MTDVDWRTWTRMLAVAKPVKPHSHATGLAFYARLAGETIESLEEKRVVRRIGKRTSVRWLNNPDGASIGGHFWGICVSPETAGVDVEKCEELLRKHFHQIQETDEALVGCEVFFDRLENANWLLGEAVGCIDGDKLCEYWEIANALGVDDAFVELLGEASREVLGSTLAKKVAESFACLDLEADIRLAVVSEGQDDAIVERQLQSLSPSPSRFVALSEQKLVVERFPRQMGDDYFGDVVRGCALSMKTFPLGELLKLLPIGWALYDAFDAIVQRRPELIARYLGHCEFHGEGAFALVQLPADVRESNEISRDLSSEWGELQGLCRDHLVQTDRSSDWSSVLGLLLGDQRREIGRDGFHPTDARSSFNPDIPRRLAGASKVSGRLEMLANELLGWLSAASRFDESVFLLGLRLMGVLFQAGESGLCVRLAVALVDKYSTGLQLDVESHSLPNYACEYGKLLNLLHRVLCSFGGGEAWSKWLRPFDAKAYVEAALADQSGVVDSTQPNPRIDVPRALLAHAEVLIAQADESDEPGDMLDAALELYRVDMAGDAPLQTFAWHSLLDHRSFTRARKCSPLFETWGRILARLPDGIAKTIQVLDVAREAHVLAGLALGAGRESEVAKVLQPHLQVALNELLTGDEGLALGHAFSLGEVLLAMGDGRNAERFSRAAIEICQSKKKARLEGYASASYALLAGALAMQKAWQELSELDTPVLDRESRHYIDGVRAIALMETERFAASEKLLLAILRENSRDVVANTNLVALKLRQGNPSEAIEAAEKAGRLLESKDMGQVRLNEAAARAKLGDTVGASRALAEADSKVEGSIDIVALLRSLHDGDRLRTPSPANHGKSDGNVAELDELAITELVKLKTVPADKADVVIVVALQEEYDAVLSRMGNRRRVQSLYNWCAGDLVGHGGRSFRVVLAWTGGSGNLRSLHTVLQTVESWRPDAVLFTGIGGGLPREALALGDVVISSAVWYYEFAKIDHGELRPRHRDTYQVDRHLLNGAQCFGRSSDLWKDCGIPAPLGAFSPKAVTGAVASGEKVIDDLGPDHVQAIFHARDDLQVIEMEAAGASEAIQVANLEGKRVAFLMIRGISDMPQGSRGSSGSDFPSAGESGSDVRRSWKRYATEIAANFVVRWIASEDWPTRLFAVPVIQ